MGPKLQAVIELQEVELQIVDIRGQLGRKERMVRGQQRRLDQVRDRIKAEELELRRAQMAFDEVDVDIKARNAQLAKHREQLNSVKTNKEYAAVLAQLNNEKADLTRTEQRAMEVMEQLETRKKSMDALRHEEQTEIARLREVQELLDQTQGTFSDRLSRLEAQRAAAAERVDAKALETFERISERYEGEATAVVQRVHPRRDEFICTGCNMSVTAEVVNALMTRDDLVTCHSCGRILTLERGGKAASRA